MDAENRSKNKYPQVTVIIPTLNEVESLPRVLPKIPPGISEILIVDGHSQDNTVKVAKQMCPQARIIYQQGKGKGDALRTGFEHATGEIIITLDADGSMDPGEITRFIEPLMNGYDFVKGSRFIGGRNTTDMPRHRVLGNRIFVMITNILFGTRYTDLAYGYNALSKRRVEKLKLSSTGFEIETEMNIKAKKAGLRICEVASFESTRLNGKGKLRSFSDGWRILKTILGERLRR